MDIATDPPANRPDAPVLHGQRIDWTGRDVFFGIVWFLLIFLILPLPPGLVLAGVYGDESSSFFAGVFVLSAVSQVAIAFVAARFTFGKYGGSWERLGVRAPTWSTLGWGVAAIVAALAVSIGYGYLVEVFDIEALMSECDDQIPQEVLDDPAVMTLATIIIVAFAPVCEELFFRGFVFPGLARWGFAAAVVASALLFSGANIGPSTHKTFVPIFAIGAIFAFAYFKSGNIISTMIAHLGFNSLSVIALWNCDPSP
jgi:membrane protease YdiL (CAAX protease family)